MAVIAESTEERIRAELVCLPAEFRAELDDLLAAFAKDMDDRASTLCEDPPLCLGA